MTWVPRNVNPALFVLSGARFSALFANSSVMKERWAPSSKRICAVAALLISLGTLLWLWQFLEGYDALDVCCRTDWYEGSMPSLMWGEGVGSVGLYLLFQV